jgi:Raf kinase inhibitor-like YbhB/YbcL family protein
MRQRRLTRTRGPVAVAIALGLLGLGRPGSGVAVAGVPAAGGRFAISSADFADGMPIPAVHAGVPPACGKIAGAASRPFTLRWQNPPGATRSFVLDVVDRDLPAQYRKLYPAGFLHWLVYNIPATARAIGPGALQVGTPGKNGAGLVGYTGPCPPKGDPPHRYRITIYAVDLPRVAGAALTVDRVEAAMRGYVLATARTIGTFKFPQQ